MWFLSRHFREINRRYHSPEGDAFALEELAPVARRFLPEGGRALEVGCGYGRNLVALWQVLEHLFGEEQKRRTLAECVRVLKPGGHLPVGTPNLWFPFDYHDNKLPLVHWVLPANRVIFALAAPAHALLSCFGSSADLILPSLRVVWKVEKRAQTG